MVTRYNQSSTTEPAAGQTGANEIATSGSPVVIDNTPPTVGQILKATSATGASWLSENPTLGGAGGLGDTANIDVRLTEYVVAYLELDGTSVTWTALGTLFDVNVGGSVVAEVRLYDLGAAGSPILPVLRSTLVFTNANEGNYDVVSQALTPSGAPGVDTDEIINTTHWYEIRAILDPADAGADGDVFHFGQVRFS